MRIIVSIDDAVVIEKILAHVERRDAAGVSPRAARWRLRPAGPGLCHRHSSAAPIAPCFSLGSALYARS